MVRLKVSAPPLDGHKFYRAGGPDKMKHAWPRGEGYALVDVCDDEEDPPKSPDHEVLRIGRKTYNELTEESNRGRLSITSADDPIGVGEMKVKLVAAQTRIAELEGDIAFITGKVPADVIKGVLADLQKSKDDKVKAAKAAKDKATKEKPKA